jgi:hypothetical protein
MIQVKISKVVNLSKNICKRLDKLVIFLSRAIKTVIIITILVSAVIAFIVIIFFISDRPTQISTGLSLIIGGVVTVIIYYYQERGQKQMHEALINIDLLSNDALDRENIFQRGFLYETFFAFMDLLSTDKTNDFCEKYENLRNFIENNHFSNFGIEKRLTNYYHHFLR